MNAVKSLATITITLTLSLSQTSIAETVIDGAWISSGDSSGNAKCTLNITSLSDHPKYGDDIFQLESSGVGACTWSGIGLSKSYAITAGIVTSGGAGAFVRITFPFGPAGNQLNIVSYNLDGTSRNNESFTRQ